MYLCLCPVMLLVVILESEGWSVDELSEGLHYHDDVIHSPIVKPVHYSGG